MNLDDLKKAAMIKLLRKEPQPQTLGTGLAANGASDLKLYPIYQQLVLKAATGDGEQPPDYETWKRSQ